MSEEEEELEKYEVDQELRLYREYRDVLPMFKYVIETERRFYLANQVDLTRHGDEGWVEVELADAWVWDMHRPARFVAKVRILTTHDVNVEELSPGDDGPVSSGEPPLPAP
jgi:hypothetical protein